MIFVIILFKLSTLFLFCLLGPAHFRLFATPKLFDLKVCYSVPKPKHSIACFFLLPGGLN